MRRERLKDQIEDRRDSLLDMFLKGMVALICIGAVAYALIGRSPPDARVTAALQKKTAAAVGSELEIVATRGHQFYWNGEGPIPVADFGSRLAAWLKATNAPRVVIGADQFARLGDTLGLLEEARRLGVTDVHLETRTRPTP